MLALRVGRGRASLRRIGITFAVYGDADAEERIIPFDIIPRILTKAGSGRGSRAAWSSASGR